MQRYSVISEKNPREILLLRGKGCRYRRCAFCDYHEDSSCNTQENLAINKNALNQVKGTYKRLEVVNSGSFCELDNETIEAILNTCIEKKNNYRSFRMPLFVSQTNNCFTRKICESRRRSKNENRCRNF